jgi:hypothetical protein
MVFDQIALAFCGGLIVISEKIKLLSHFVIITEETCQLFQLAVAGASFLCLVGNILVRGIGKSWFIGESVIRLLLKRNVGSSLRYVTVVVVHAEKHRI